jgi:kinetochor protein Mis14/NSL1
MIGNASKEAREKLDKHLPPDATANQDDALRRRVEEITDNVGSLR